MSPGTALDAPSTRPRCLVGGVPLTDGSMDDFVHRFVGLAQQPDTHVAVGINAHVTNMSARDPRLHRQLQSTINYADGQSVVWASRLLGHGLTERVATTDFAEPLLHEAARRRLPVFFFGAEPGVAELAARRLRKRIDGLRVATHHGFVDDDAAVLQAISQHGTAILFVGLGNPRQEEWVAEHADRLPPLVLTCGGLFDWLSGSNPRAPRWIRRAGLEWLWRLGLEPRRLGARYLVGNPVFVSSVLRQRRRARRIGAGGAR